GALAVSVSPVKSKKQWLLTLGAPVVLMLAYFVAAAVVFDFSQAAFPGDEDNTADGRPVALGPRPRQLFCRPTVHGVCWEGREWPFVVLASVLTNETSSAINRRPSCALS